MGSPGGDQEAGSAMDQEVQLTKCGGDERAEHAKGGRNHRASRKPDVVSTPGLSDRAAIGTTTSVGTSVYDRSTINRHQTEADTNTDIFFQSRRRTDRGRHKQPGNHINCEGKGNRWNDH